MNIWNGRGKVTRSSGGNSRETRDYCWSGGGWGSFGLVDYWRFCLHRSTVIRFFFLFLWIVESPSNSKKPNALQIVQTVSYSIFLMFCRLYKQQVHFQFEWLLQAVSHLKIRFTFRNSNFHSNFQWKWTTPPNTSISNFLTFRATKFPFLRAKRLPIDTMCLVTKGTRRAEVDEVQDEGIIGKWEVDLKMQDFNVNRGEG